MNDANEMRSGALAFSDLFETRKGSLSIDEQEHVRDSGVLTGSGAFRNFLVSAAMDPDNLTLWRNYGESEVAYSIELDAHIHLIPLQITDAGEHPNPPAGYFDREQDFDPGTGESFYVGPDPDHVFTLGGSWDKVTYIASENDPKVLETFDKMIADHRMHASMGKRLLAVPVYALTNSVLDFFKDRGFEDEREVRAVHWVNPWWKFVRYRASRFGVVPYIELTGRSKGEDSEWASSPSLLPIRNLTIGPNAPEHAEEALRELAAANGYGDVPIHRSKTPYR